MFNSFYTLLVVGFIVVILIIVGKDSEFWEDDRD